MSSPFPHFSPAATGLLDMLRNRSRALAQCLSGFTVLIERRFTRIAPPVTG